MKLPASVYSTPSRRRRLNTTFRDQPIGNVDRDGLHELAVCPYVPTWTYLFPIRLYSLSLTLTPKGKR